MLIGLGEARREAEESRIARASEARFRALLEADPNAILALDEESRVTWATRQAGELFGCPVDRLIGVALGDLVALHKDETPTHAGRSTGLPIGDDRPAHRRHALPGRDRPEHVRARRPAVPGRGHLGRHVAPRGGPDPRSLPRRPVARAPDARHLDLRRHAAPARSGRAARPGDAQRAPRQRRGRGRAAPADDREPRRDGPHRARRRSSAGSGRCCSIGSSSSSWSASEASGRRSRSSSPRRGRVQMVAADEEYLAQIMRNLLSNAAKYSGAGSTVEVSLEDGEGEVLIRVRDDGPGHLRGRRRPALRALLPVRAPGRDRARRGNRPVRVPRARGDDGRPDLGHAAARARARSSGSASRPTSMSSTLPADDTVHVFDRGPAVPRTARQRTAPSLPRTARRPPDGTAPQDAAPIDGGASEPAGRMPSPVSNSNQEPATASWPTGARPRRARSVRTAP